MYNDINRDQEYISQLKKFLFENYAINVLSIIPAMRGYYGETWKAETITNNYFIKIDYLSRHQQIFKNSLPVIEYLVNNGIDFIGNIIKTTNNELSATFNNGVVGVFEWIDGKNNETDDTKASEYQMLCQIYPLTKPGFDIPTLNFNDAAVKKFYENYEYLKSNSHIEANQKVLDLLKQEQTNLENNASRLQKAVLKCQNNTDDFYLTHGDAGGNHFEGINKNYILDWDEVMYASLERDAWVMCCKDFARDLFNEILKANHIDYQLKPERLAFYCYHMYFYYLNEFLADHKYFDMSERIFAYFKDSWINDRIKYANTIEL